MAWTLGKAEKKDFSAINHLFKEMLRTIYHTDKVDGYGENALDRFFIGGEEWICVARAEGKIVAFLSIEVHRKDRDYLYFDDLSVTESYRNQGIGTALLRSGEAYAEEIGISAVCFHVEKSNQAAFRLYERLGYRVFEDQGNRLLMRKTV